MKHQLSPFNNHNFVSVSQNIGEFSDTEQTLLVQFSINKEIDGDSHSIIVFIRGDKKNQSATGVSALVRYSDVWLAVDDAEWSNLLSNVYDCSELEKHPLYMGAGVLNVFEFAIDKTKAYGRIELMIPCITNITINVIAASMVTGLNEQPNERSVLSAYSLDRQPTYIFLEPELPKAQSEMS